ncbi:MAG: T9SS type A sorting domain-containing protein [Bacteroidales bacterium]|nr:T9SS type A sorting domain-containing protein [Bacteroidales bacterium]MCF8455033.1 T9SS type A sorting domain-containing protein [Bacteroidales bacterium]
MRTKKNTKGHNLIFLSIAFTIASLSVNSQCIYMSDFESGSMSDWVIASDSAYISTEQAHGGIYSLKIFKSGGYAQVNSADNEFCFGTYSGWFYLTGYYSDVYFRFHHDDNDNFYQLSMIPMATDNPTLKLLKTVNGTSTILASVAPIFGLNEWFKMTLERYVNGDIKVYINNIFQFEVNDVQFMTPAMFSFWSYDLYSYFDDFCYDTSYMGKEELEVSNEIAVYPNPVLSDLYITRRMQATDFNIFDLSGKIVYSGPLTDKIDVSFLNSGYYHIVFHADNKEVFRQRFLKAGR